MPMVTRACVLKSVAFDYLVSHLTYTPVKDDVASLLCVVFLDQDPWMTPSKAARIMELKPTAFYKPVLAGHCPQDDAPVVANEALADWAGSLTATKAAQ